MTITKLQAKRLLLADMEQARQAVARHLHEVPLNPQQHDALASFAFNIGGGAFKDSSVLRHLKAGRVMDAIAVWLTYTRDSFGRIQPGLVKRRRQEVALFLGV